MKRKNKKVPGFDEIIFENRNKEYGAYDIRKRYNSTTSISILGGAAFCALLLAAFSFSSEKGTASDGPKSVIIEISDPIIPDPVKPQTRPPEQLAEALKNLAPIVSSDPSEKLSETPTAGELLETVNNEVGNDSAKYVEIVDPAAPAVREPFIKVEEMPEFPGGIPELMKYIGRNILYPEDAIRNNIQGRVILRFAVNTDGTIDRISVLRGIDSSLDNEAVRVVNTLPRFKPGKQGGVPVPVWFSLPVLFRLENH